MLQLLSNPLSSFSTKLPRLAFNGGSLTYSSLLLQQVAGRGDCCLHPGGRGEVEEVSSTWCLPSPASSHAGLAGGGEGWSGCSPPPPRSYPSCSAPLKHTTLPASWRSSIAPELDWKIWSEINVDNQEN